MEFSRVFMYCFVVTVIATMGTSLPVKKVATETEMQNDIHFRDSFLHQSNMKIPIWLKRFVNQNTERESSRPKRTTSQRRSMIDLTDPANQEILKMLYDWRSSNGYGTPQNRFGRSLWKKKLDTFRKPESENFETLKRHQTRRYERSVYVSPASKRVLEYFFKHFTGGNLQFRFG